MNILFKSLSLGARFSDPEILSKTYVKLSASTAVEFHKNESIVCFNKPLIVAIWPDFHVTIRESYVDTNHEYPMPAYDEGYRAYMRNPHLNNPYEEGSDAHRDWNEGFCDADWDDCE
jgi:hypothetical protein